MAASEENSSLFPIFILTIMAIPLVPYTILKLCRAASTKTKSIHCKCSECTRSGKYRKSIFKRVSSFLVPWSSPQLHISHKVPLFYLTMVSILAFLQISNFSTYSNLTLILLWVVMIVLVYYIKNMSREVNILIKIWTLVEYLNWFICLHVTSF